MIKKKTMWKIITVTMVALAVAILVTAGAGVLSIAGDLFPKGNDTEGSGEDTKAPTLKADSDTVILYTGDTLSFRKFVNISDNSEGDIKLEQTKSNVNQNVPGEYEVTLVAVDAAGNKSKPLTLKVIVKDKIYSEESLMKLIADTAAETVGYTKEEAKANNYSKEKIVKDIYDFVRDPDASAKNANIEFDNSRSNTPSQLIQNGQKNREGWKIDWIEEAYRTLNMDDMSGDCYTYYSVSKAFFEYFGIENVGIQRAESSTQGGTHYWHAVKVEQGWYYYDGTRSGSSFHSDGVVDQNSCLITEGRLLSYRINDPDEGTRNDDYYVLDKTNPEFFDADDNGGKFPTIETKKLGQ